METSKAKSMLINRNFPVKNSESAESDGLLTGERILLQTLIDYLPDRIYVKDLQGRKIVCNKADMEASGGNSLEDVLGKSDFETYDAELAEKFWVDDQRVLNSGEPIVNREEPGLDAAGNTVCVLSTKVPLRNSQDEICGLIGIGREITSLKAAEKRLQIAAAMARTASSTLKFDELLARVIGLIEEMFNYYHVGIYLVDPANRIITLYSCGGHLSEALMVSPPSMSMDGPNVISLVVRTNNPYLTPDVVAETAFTHHALLPETASQAIFPLAIGKKVIGVLDFQSMRVNDFQPSNVSILSTLADQIAMAIQNAYLYKNSLIRAEQLQKLSQATANIMGQLGKSSIEKILTLIAKYSTELLDAEACGVHIVHREGFLKLTASYGHREGGFPKGLELAIVSGPRTGLTGHIAYEGRLFNEYGEKLNRHFAVREGSNNHLKTGKCYSMLAIPLFKGSGEHRKLVGLLRADNKKKDGVVSSKNYFNEVDEWILTIFANAVVMAIESAQLVDQIKRARKASQEIAKVSTIGNLGRTLKSIVEGARSALGCDIATLYTYDDRAQRCLQVIGVGCASSNLIAPEKVTETSTVWKIMHLEKLTYVADDVSKDEFLSGSFAVRERIRSTLAVKLMYVNRPMGVLFINHREYHQFKKGEIEVVEQFGHQAAIAIRNEQLYHETHRLFQLLQALNSTLASSRPLEETLSLIVEQAVRISGVTGTRADFGSISLIEGKRLQYKVAWPKKGLTRLKQLIGDIDLVGRERIGITGRAVKKKKSLNVTNVKLDPDFICVDEKIHSELAVPIRYENRVIGVINLEHHEPGAFDGNDVYMLEKLADQVAVTIQAAKHYEEIRYDAAMRTGLLRVGQAILKTQDPNKLMQILVDEIQESLQADIVTLYTYDQKNDRVSLQVNYAGKLLKRHSALELHEVSEQSIVRTILRNKIPIFANDTLHHPLMNIGDFAQHEKIRSSAGIPLLIADEPVGVIFLNYRTPHQFSNQQQEDMKLFATQAALAIQNARSYEDLKQQKGLVGSRTALAFMGMANTVWRHSIEGHVINIRNTTTLMQQDMEQGQMPEKECIQLSKRINIIEAEAEKVLEMEMTPRLSEDHAEVILLNDLIRERINQLKALESYKDVRFSFIVDGDIRIRVSPEWFRKALDILIDNGIKAMKKAPHKEIRIHTSQTDKWVEVMVTDRGRGISPKIADRILKDRIINKSNQKGFGIGLLIAQAILQTYNGDVKLVTTGPKGTMFAIVLPVVRTVKTDGVS